MSATGLLPWLSLFARRSLSDLQSPDVSKKISTRCPRNEKKERKEPLYLFVPSRSAHRRRRRVVRSRRRAAAHHPLALAGALVVDFERSLGYVRASGQGLSLLSEVERGGLQAPAREERGNGSSVSLCSRSCALKRRRPSTIDIVDTASLISSYLRRRGPCLRRRWRRRAIDLHLVLVRRHFDGEVRENERV